MHKKWHPLPPFTPGRVNWIYDLLLSRSAVLIIDERRTYYTEQRISDLLLLIYIAQPGIIREFL